MKRFIILVALLGNVLLSWAQGGSRFSPEDRARTLKIQLNLSDAQMDAITQIYKDQQEAIDKIRSAANGDRDAMRVAIGPITQRTQSKINALLTHDQASSYKKILYDRAATLSGGGNNPYNRPFTFPPPKGYALDVLSKDL